ncbi:hypothetical protein [Agromyces bauzanensis]|uniref:Uncharacterized protein n=1 Tax=Agromyces bauzanensis TaxID=1308924 RepID=A0A917PDQ5_9MICO|nr:hypothetical protein [Agromyces bauzanensis]GGJ71772.1 hypothetical protein GCM10011372_07160 [Agromyces bauzanensis]
MSHREPHAAPEPRTGAVMGMRSCESAATCRSDRPGHGLHAMQERLAVATATKWVDAIVVEVDEHGFATLAELGDVGGAAAAALGVRRVWHHDAFEGGLAPGEPVAIHALYGVLARGRQRFSVADA